MKLKASFAAALILISAAASAFAGEQNLIHIHSNARPDFDLKVLLDSNGDLTGLAYGVKTFTLQQVNDDDGAVLLSVHKLFKDWKVVGVKGKNVSPRDGGELELETKTDQGGFPKYSKFEMSIERVGNSWLIYTDRDHGHIEFNGLDMQAGKSGIDTVTPTMNGKPIR